MLCTYYTRILYLAQRTFLPKQQMEKIYYGWFDGNMRRGNNGRRVRIQRRSCVCVCIYTFVPGRYFTLFIFLLPSSNSVWLCPKNSSSVPLPSILARLFLGPPPPDQLAPLPPAKTLNNNPAWRACYTYCRICTARTPPNTKHNLHVKSYLNKNLEMCIFVQLTRIERRHI